MRLGGNVCRLLHQLDLFRRLEHTHLVNDSRGIDNHTRGMNRLPVHRAHLRNLANDCVVEIRVYTEAVVKLFSAVENVLQLLGKLRDGKRFVGAEITFRAFNAGAAPNPDFLFRIARAHEKRVLVFSSRRDNGDRVWFFEAGQVVKIRILAKAILRVVGARGFACTGNNSY